MRAFVGRFASLRPFALVALAALAVGALGGAAYATADALAVSGNANASMSFSETSATTFTGISLSVTPGVTFTQRYTTGTGVNQVSKKWCQRRSIAASGADTLDLDGTLTNEYGGTVSFATIKALQIKADTGNTNDVWMGGAAVNRFNTFLKDSSVSVVRPGYTIFMAGGKSGYAVTAGTGDDLLIKNSAGGSLVNYELCLGGT